MSPSPSWSITQTCTEECSSPVHSLTHHVLKFLLLGVPAEGAHDLVQLLGPDRAAAVPIEEGEDLSVLVQDLPRQLLRYLPPHRLLHNVSSRAGRRTDLVEILFIRVGHAGPPPAAAALWLPCGQYRLSANRGKQSQSCHRNIGVIILSDFEAIAKSTPLPRLQSKHCSHQLRLDSLAFHSLVLVGVASIYFLRRIYCERPVLT